MNLIILESHELNDSGRCVLCDGRAEHVASILKSQPGDRIEIGLVNGPRGRGEITALQPGRVELLCHWDDTPPAAPPVVDVICALPRPQTLKKVLHTAAAMSVRHLWLVRTSRVEKSYFHSPLLQEANLRAHLIEGLSQGKSTRLPQVSIHPLFRQFFEDFLPAQPDFNSSLKLVADLDSPTTLLHLPRPAAIPTLLAIGPEGGWVPFELDRMDTLGFTRFQLGPWVLRVENGLVAALAQLELARAGRL